MVSVAKMINGSNYYPPRTAMYVVAARNAAGYVKAQADYVCDGINDYADIQNIFDTVLAGKNIHFIGGAFNLSDGLIISSKSGFEVFGSGCFRLNRADAASPLANTKNVLTLIDCSDFCIDNLEIDGNRHCDIVWGVDNTDYAPVTQYLAADVTAGTPTVMVTDGSKFVVGERIQVYGGLTVAGGVEKDRKDDNGGGGFEIIDITGNVLTLEANLTNSYTHTGTAGGGYVTTYATGDGNTVGSYTLGGEDQQNGIHMIECSHGLIKNCYLHDFWESPIKCGVGFGVLSSVLASRCHDIHIVNNKAILGYDQGISVWISNDIFVTDNYIEEGGWGGIVLTASESCIVSGNTSKRNFYRVPADTNSGHGIAIEGGLYNTIIDNIITENHSNGVHFANSPINFGITSTTLTGGVSWGSTVLPVANPAGFTAGATYFLVDGLKSEPFTVASVVGNDINITMKTKFFHPTSTVVGGRLSYSNIVAYNEISESDEGHGIYITRSVNNHIEHNSVMRNYRKGCLIETVSSLPSQGNYIEDNIFDGNGYVDNGQAVLIDVVDYTHVNRNTVLHNFNEKGIVFKGTIRSECNSNKVHDTTNEGISFEDGGGVTCSNCSICDNEVEQVDSTGIRVFKGSYMTIERNVCKANAGEGGIHCGGVTYSSISNNRCISNQTNGIKLADEGGVACTYNTIAGNIVMDDGTGTKGSDRSAITQTNSIVLSGNEDHNNVIYNRVDAAATKVGVNTVITLLP